MFIYMFTSPSNRQYIGKSTVTENKKRIMYESAVRTNENDNRIIHKALNKYGWDNMNFEIIEEGNWTNYEINAKEIFYIDHFKTYIHDSKNGYNLTRGGDGLDSETAKRNATLQHKNMTPEQKKIRAKNCSTGQRRRFQENPESNETKNRKRKAHEKSYLIEAPDGRTWQTNKGLKRFAEEHADEIEISYWALFNAYRKSYSNTKTTRKTKTINKWKVVRID